MEPEKRWYIDIEGNKQTYDYWPDALRDWKDIPETIRAYLCRGDGTTIDCKG
jgi:hypothetical protein